jgi:hypothetical protein
MKIVNKRSRILTTNTVVYSGWESTNLLGEDSTKTTFEPRGQGNRSLVGLTERQY